MTMCMENEQFQNFNCMSNCIGHGVMILVKKHIPILEHMHFKEQNVEALLANPVMSPTIHGGPHYARELLLFSLQNILQHN
jgi:hypothetical protein